jgi:hypothetical protein
MSLRIHSVPVQITPVAYVHHPRVVDASVAPAVEAVTLVEPVEKPVEKKPTMAIQVVAPTSATVINHQPVGLQVPGAHDAPLAVGLSISRSASPAPPSQPVNEGVVMRIKRRPTGKPE